VLEDVLQDDAVEALVIEGQRLGDVGQQHLPPALHRRLDHLRRRVDPDVIRKALGQPSRAAADVENLRLSREMPRDVPVVARFSVPVGIGHRRMASAY
jgi:hypothetical protein